MSRLLCAALLLAVTSACSGADPGDSSGDSAGEDSASPAAPAHYARAAGDAVWIDACAGGADLAPSNPDENTVEIDFAGFDFLFFGQPQDSMKASTNGWLSFSDFLTDSAPRHDQGKATLPSEGAPNAAIYALWEDLRVDATDGLCAARTGSGDAELLTVQWNAKFVTNGGPGGDIGDLAFQVQLAEGSNVVQILWETVDASGDAAGRLEGSTVGLENEADLGTSHPGTEAALYDGTVSAGAAAMFTPSDA